MKIRLIEFVFIHNAWERQSPNNGFQEVRHIYCKFQHCVILTLVVTFHLASGKKHFQYVEELTIVDLETHSTLNAETFTNSFQFAPAHHVVHIAQGNTTQELIL